MAARVERGIIGLCGLRRPKKAIGDCLHAPRPVFSGYFRPETIVRLFELERLVVERAVHYFGERDVVRFRREVIDDLERIGDADLYGALRRRCEKAVVPSATIAMRESGRTIRHHSQGACRRA